MRTVAVSLALLALFPATASAHATLEGSQPSRGGQIDRAPESVTLRFDEAVEVAFGAVRVYDAAGERVDRGPTRHPGGRGAEVAVDLRPALPDGVYTATYRVISADSHPVTGGFVFTVGEGGAAPRLGVDELIDSSAVGPVTETAFGVARALGYLAIALGAGGLFFAWAVWRPAQREAGAADAAGAAFGRRLRALLLGAAATGVLTSALGIVLQGATAGATSFWAALDAQVIEDVLGTRFGTVWGLRLCAWIGFGLLIAVRVPRAAPAPALLAAFICVTPALGGHASTQDPAVVLVPANALHVSAMAVWVGGVATLLLALPAATRRLAPGQRTPLLAAAVGRFSTVALFAVAGLVASGVLQAIVELDAFSNLWDSAFGRAILVKSALVVALVGLGAFNRTRARPRLARQAEVGESPGAAGVLLRRALIAEAGLMLGVLAATAALASYSPPASASGPFSAAAELGPARMEVTVDPARAGPNQVHLYLFDRRDGAQFDRVKELALSTRQPERHIGPLQLEPLKAGPGHWVVRRADIAPAGDWVLEVSARVSEFDAYTAKLEVPVR